MALVTVNMPRLGESVTEGTVERWLKTEGELVARDEPLVEVVTDKVNAEIPSPFEGRLVRIDAQAGQVVPVGAAIAIIEQSETAGEPAEAATPEAPPVEEVTPAAGPAQESRRPLLSPAVRRRAEEHGIDLATVAGTGTAGRITRADVEEAIAAAAASQHPSGPTAAPAPPAPPTAGAAEQPPEPDEELLPLSAVRRQIAEHMAAGAAIPTAWGMREVDMTALVRYREEQKESFLERHGHPLTFLPFLIPVVCDALKANPLLNSSWREDGILLKRSVNLGVAIAVEDAVVVPVIKNADRLGLSDLAAAVHDLTVRAREKRLRPDDVRGGTFTLNNTGAFGGMAGMPIINHPQAAILNTETITKRPVVRDDAIVIRDIMMLTISFDHRILDGLQVGRFMRMIQHSLESWTPAMIRL